MFENLTFKDDGATAQLCLNRPQKLNPLSQTTQEELSKAAEHLDRAANVPIIIIGGRGHCFSAGADLDSFSPAGERGAREFADAGRRMADADSLLSGLWDPECVAARSRYVAERSKQRASST
ncbi:MAG: enoyl-CoA hydratase/isomerase family protein [Congregibacter sp.]